MDGYIGRKRKLKLFKGTCTMRSGQGNVMYQDGIHC